MWDARVAANIFLQICAGERRDNMSDCKFTNPDGSIDPLSMGVPRGWDVLEKMPKAGIFHFTYKCGPEDRKFEARRNLLTKYGRWQAVIPEGEVSWWAAPSEAPEDVLEFLFWMRAKYKNTETAFAAFDGSEGNGVISMREFEEGIKRLNCKKFAGANEKQRLMVVFKFLDPSGEGQVSKNEFMVVDQFWNEVVLSITEFLQFSERTFGPDLADLWNALDEDKSGSIQVDEWTEALTQVGYFGPSGPIFSLVDEDDEGSVSWEEFQTLRQFQTLQQKRRASMA
eukprot:CAMPEP_0115149250 /NCGR_PEP_ID=MMETSP0227-20121206/64333_1 /TAXON_ID=89957 /ORGANISM="Polarella glacialis, Strain CCMP 1383" /LENGTH=282 /DNA_ID=CAMNT_0002559391 /DNA_START=1 /DNA_END=846 /DNA_ORIENTATION=-